MEGKRRFEMDLLIGGREYFLRQASSGLVAGPKNRNGFDRHITVVVDPETELLKNVHMKSGRGGVLSEDWRLHPTRIMSYVNSWIRKNSVSLDNDEVRRIDGSSYVVSGRRILISYHIIQAIGSKIFWILFRGFRLVPFDIVETDRESHVRWLWTQDNLRNGYADSGFH